MAFRAYAYPAKRVVSLLNDDEWAQMGLALDKSYANIRRVDRRPLTDQDWNTAFQPAFEKYTALTGDHVENFAILHKLRLSQYGALCSACKKPFRTPRAKLCAECGYRLPQGKRAGPLRPRG